MRRLFRTKFFSYLAKAVSVWVMVVMAAGTLMSSAANAQFTVAVSADLPRTTDNILTTISTSLTRAAMVAFFNAAQTFLGQLAYDAAEYIATGGSGQTSAYYKKSVGDYFSDVANDAAGDFIGSLSQDQFFQTIGFDLCRPDARVLLRLQLSLGNFFPGLQSRFSRPRPRCDFKQIEQNYDQFYANLTNDEILSNIQTSLNTQSSDLGVSLNILNRFRLNVGERVNSALSERAEGGGFRSVNNIISGNIRTPGQVVSEVAREQLVRYPNASTLTSVGAILSSGMSQGFGQLASYTASIFINTLASKLLRRLFTDGLDAQLVRLQSGSDAITTFSKTDFRNINLALKTPNLAKVEEFNSISELAACPEQGRGTWNCAIDQGLRTALVRNDQGNMTIRAALDAGLLHGDWQLIPSTDLRRNQDPNCYTQAYCSGNIQKLRVLRILPVGLELAANSPENLRRCGPQGTGCVTLREVVEGFSQCEGASTPWCKLVDPNWVLASVPQQCTIKGYGDRLISSTLGQRREECQDIQTCLQRNDRGECVGGYGYCLAEKSVYRFGANECLPREASCRAYQDRAGQTVAYLRNSLDYGTCTNTSVGCFWYSSKRVPNAGLDAWEGTVASGPRVYFNKNVQTCPADADGCTDLREIPRGQSALNLLQNPSFEQVQDLPETGYHSVLSWESTVGSPRFAEPLVNNGVATAEGDQVLALGQGGISTAIQKGVEAYPGRIYTLSMYLRRTSEDATPGDYFSAQFIQRNAANEIVQATNEYQSPTSYCTRMSGDRLVPGTMYVDGFSAGTEWTRYECSYLTTSSTRIIDVQLYGSNVVVDAVQLEEGEFATAFLNGLNTSLRPVHMKIAPDELACTGNAATDSPQCARYAKACRQIDAGCSQYTDVQNPSDQIPAILTENDLCFQDCVGYAEYRKSPSSFDLVAESDERFSDPSDNNPEYFIPSTAQSCTQEEVGCEAFTNIAASGTSAEQLAYFSYTQSCRTPGADTRTYFTWEGSDTAGYQLRTWSLIREGVTEAPKILVKREPGNLYPKDPSSCNEGLWRSALDPDCRQLYDVQGNAYYRYFSQLVISSTSCESFRLSNSNPDDCQKTDGVFDASNSSCLYQVERSGSRVCRAQAVGCREYQGGTAGATTPVLSEAFATAQNSFTGGRLSEESLLVGDTSLRFDAPAGTSASVFTNLEIPANTNRYLLTFWAKAGGAAGTIQVSTRDAANRSSAPTAVGAAQLGSEWRRFTMGPFLAYPLAASTTLVFTAVGQTSSYAAFIDQVSVTRQQDTVYVNEGSWQTPELCNQNRYGVAQPQAMLGCKAYTNRDGATVYARQFSRLCKQEAIGCKAYVDTRNSAGPQAETFLRGDTPAIPGFGAATTVRGADRYIYLVDDPAYYCDSANASCRGFGKPIFSVDRSSIERFETVYLKDDITTYEASLCKPSELFCEQYTNQGSTEYFRNPDTHVCEYRENVTDVADVPAGTYNGWFQKGVSPSTPCYPEMVADGKTFGLARAGDSLYRGWVGLCPAGSSECTELRDPNDTTNPQFPGGQPYYFLRDDKLDTTSCNGSVNPGEGCVLMRDTSDASERYSTKATYASYEAASASGGVRPIDCQNEPSNEYCVRQQQARTVGVGTAPRCTRQSYSAISGTTLFSDAPNGDACRQVRRNQSYCRGGNIEIFSDAEAATRLASYAQGGESVFVAGPTAAGSADLGALDVNVCRVNADCDTVTPVQMQQGGGSIITSTGVATVPPNTYYVRRTGGTCLSDPTSPLPNDANVVVKVKLDRDCSQWLGCSSSEVVYDPSLGRMRSICTNSAVCDQASASTGDAFCAHYTDRSSTSSEPVLAQGLALTQQTYVNRSVGFGQKDYSGYTMPNAFSVADLKSVRISEGVSRNANSLKQANDYRLAAAVPMPRATRLNGSGSPTDPCSRGGCFNQATAQGNQAQIMDARTPLGGAYPELRLCRHVQTGLIGFFDESMIENPRENVCYLATSFVLPDTTSPQLTQYDFPLLAQSLTSSTATKSFISEAFPAPECRANPEPDSPFPSSYVTRWDMSKTPPAPQERLAGYTRVNVCQLGEDCACSYQRADYTEAGVSKFFGVASQDIPTGICAGGPRDGQSCIVGALYGSASSTTSGDQTSAQRVVDQVNSASNCGSPDLGGRCVALSRVETVRGIFGQCLERDITQSGSSAGTSCLAWNPNPVLYGDKDVYHYTPSAGYQPPPSSGQYYCVSTAKAPSKATLIKESFQTFDIDGTSYYAGKIKDLSYDDEYVSDEDMSDAALDGAIISNSYVSADDCEYADDDQDDGFGQNPPGSSDQYALRLVTTGSRKAKGYAETFFPVRTEKIASALTRKTSLNDPQILANTSDLSLGYISINPMAGYQGRARLACGYQADWVDGMGQIGYDDVSSVQASDNVWRQKFYEAYNPFLSRASEKLLTAKEDSQQRPLTMPCVTARGGAAGQCYFKTWETGLRADENRGEVFKGVVGRSGAINSLPEIQKNPYFDTCDANRPYFAIRAVFQTSAAAGSQGGRSREDFSAATGVVPNGPWQFVGFWVATCGGQADDQRYIYMNVSIVSADICREIAEVRSSDTLQDAAYTDRVWKDGTYVQKTFGTRYNSRYAPFSSILNNRSAGKDAQPIFQTGQEFTAGGIGTNQTFIGSGAVTYGASDIYPKDSWAHISNLFARVYKVYRYETQAVSYTSTACLYGPMKGRACDPTGTNAARARTDASVRTTSTQCSLAGVCDTSQAVAEDPLDSGVRVCDSLSGINAGLYCSDDPDVCHTGPAIARSNGTTEQFLHACKVSWAQPKYCGSTDTRCDSDPRVCAAGQVCAPRAGEVINPVDGRVMPLEPGIVRSNISSADPVLVCAGGVRVGQACSGVADFTRECPAAITGRCLKPGQNPDVAMSTQVRAQQGRCAMPRLVKKQNGELLFLNPIGGGYSGYVPDLYEVRSDNSLVRRSDYPDVSVSGGRELDYKQMPPVSLQFGFDDDPASVQVTYNGENVRAVYDLIQNDYGSCFSDSDCSFTWDNYWYKADSSENPIRTIQSRRSLSFTANCNSGDPSNCPPGQVNGINYPSADQACNTDLPGTRAPTSISTPYPNCTQLMVTRPIHTLKAPYTTNDGTYSLPPASQQRCFPTSGDVVKQIASEYYRGPGTMSLSSYAQGLTDACTTPSGWLLTDQDPPPEGDAYGNYRRAPLLMIGSCVPATKLANTQIGSQKGRCKGGVYEGRICSPSAAAGTQYSCAPDLSQPVATATLAKYGPPQAGGAQSVSAVPISTLADYENYSNVCGLVATPQGSVNQYQAVQECRVGSVANIDVVGSVTLDTDNNICTHGIGYRPRLDLCPNPDDEFCGLVAYRKGDAASLSPLSTSPIATDVTQGNYTPNYLVGRSSNEFTPTNFSYVSVYKPYPPQVVAPDVSSCTTPGQCKVQQANAILFNGQTEGTMSIAGGQHKSTIQFYAWAAHNQMPIKRMTIDWGDGSRQELPEASIKNHKPYCGVAKECFIPTGPNRGHTGLTCQTDSDCPTGMGRCEAIGTCSKRQDVMCTSDADCQINGSTGEKERCQVRTFFGNSPEACEQNYFEFNHMYICTGPGSLQQCNTTQYTCSSDPSRRCTGASDTISCAPGDRCIQGQAPTNGGCWDSVTQACRFTPRVLVEDNWGWCTGECRQARDASGAPVDAPQSQVVHPYGGCYAGSADGQASTRFNNSRAENDVMVNECAPSYPNNASPASQAIRPWVVYPGSLILRAR